MSKYTTLYTSKIIEGIAINKIKKDGTQRTFFVLVNRDTGWILYPTAFARLYDATSQAKQILHLK